VLSPHRIIRMSMLHSRKADLKIFSFERDIAGKINSDGGAATPRSGILAQKAVGDFSCTRLNCY
jgi:hypothetical protein